jgi:hypothetical protein
MKRFVWSLSIGLLISVLSCSTAWAQATAQISGAVRDQSSAVLPGAEVTATQTETGIVRNTISNETGSYVLSNLPLGPYRLEVSLPGFRTFVQTGIVLQVNSNPVINAILEVGQVTEQVEVQANAALVETRTVGVGQIMEQERILELPLNGRNVTDLITLGGGAVDVAQYSSSPRSMQGQRAISVAGGLASGVTYTLDGAMHNNAYDNLSLPLPFPDALQEFKVETSALSASQGQHAAAQVSSVTKSGTNEFHGSLFEFVRNDLLNATEYFAAVDPATGRKKHSTLKRNQFGGTLGGPIVSNKLFFFGGYQGTISRQDAINTQRWVPTPAMMQGDFTTVASAACGQPRTLGGPFQGNRVDPSSFNRVALNVVAKLPQATDPCGLVVIGVPQQDNDHQFVGKGDWQLNSNHSLLGRALITGNTRPVPFDLAPDNILTTFDRGWSNWAESYTVGDTWLASPQTVIATRLAANYTNVQRLGAEFDNWGDLGVQNYYSYQPDYLQLNISNPGFALGGGTANTSTYRTFSTGLNIDASLSRGTHQWAIGGALAWIDSNSNANVQSSGSFSFTGQRSGTPGLPLADFLLGLPSSFAQAAPNTDYMRKWYTALYLADSWKMNSRLTLNYGLRWEPDLAETLTLGRVTTYSEERRAAGIQSTVFRRAPLGFHFPGDPDFPGKKGREENWWTFAPRFGFALDVNGDGRTSIRGSVGIGYDYPNAQYHLWTSIVPPWGGATNIVNPSFDNPWASYPGGNPFPVQYGPDSPFVLNGQYTTMSNLDPAQTQNWNLALQRQLGTDWLISASYLGSHSIHLLGSEQLNPGIYFPGNADANGNCFAQGLTFRTTAGAVCSTTTNTNARRRLSVIDNTRTGQFVQNLVEIQSGGNSSYNGLLLEVRKRATRGVTVSGNYTWSHCIGPYQGNEGGDTGANPAIPNPYVGNRDAGRGNCLSDIRHGLNLTSVLETPRFETTALRYLASGWRLSTIYRVRTGSYMSIQTGSNLDLARNGTNINSQPAQYLGGDPIGDDSGRPGTFWINRAAYAQPALGTIGNAGTRTVAGPNQWDLDVAVTRAFRLTEAQRLEFRWEAYNVTNSFRSQNPSNDVTNQLFGQIRQARDPRIMQFALKYIF